MLFHVMNGPRKNVKWAPKKCAPDNWAEQMSSKQVSGKRFDKHIDKFQI